MHATNAAEFSSRQLRHGGPGDRRAMSDAWTRGVRVVDRDGEIFAVLAEGIRARRLKVVA
jgi:hypothetical protein